MTLKGDVAKEGAPHPGGVPALRGQLRPGVSHGSLRLAISPRGWGWGLVTLLLVGNPDSGRLQETKAQRGLRTCSRSHSWRKKGKAGGEGGWEGLVGLLGPLDPEAGPECLCSPTGRAVTVNGVSVTPPKVYSGPGLSLRPAGLFLLLSTRVGLTLLWDGGQHPTRHSADPRPAAPTPPHKVFLLHTSDQSLQITFSSLHLSAL